VDVGYGQLAWSLREDDRVTVLERTHVNDLTPTVPGAPFGIVVADLSFISLTKVLVALVGLAAADADLVLLIKPQFEVGRASVGKGGVVRSPELRERAVRAVAESAPPGWGVRGLCASPLPGPAGNVEYLLWLKRGAPPVDPAVVAHVVAEGPQ
jgi:23S rRNA (cytidine1920-2'-O)/16S rRNA (cytidine1409-2'-O)-methyltransferase